MMTTKMIEQTKRDLGQNRIRLIRLQLSTRRLRRQISALRVHPRQSLQAAS